MFKQIDRRLFTILVIVFVQLVGASMILPILPLYARRTFNISDNVVTLIISSFFLAQFLAGPVLGRMSDLYGRLPILIISQIGTAISFVLIGMAGNVELLFVARILDGITGGNIVVAQAYVTDITSPKQRTQALGYVFMAFGVGFIFGPSIGGILSSTFGPRIPFLFAAFAAVLTVALTWFTLDETLTPEQRQLNRAKSAPKLQVSTVIQNHVLAVILLVTFGAQFSFSLMQSTFALYGEDVLFRDYTAQEVTLRVGLLLSMVGVGQLITQVFILKRLLARYRENTLVIIGGVLRGAGMLSVVLLPNPYLAAVSVLVFAIGAGIQVPALQSIASNSVPNEVRGGVLGVYQSTQSLSIIFGSALAGTLFSVAPATPYLLGGTIFIAMLLPFFWATRREATAPV